MKLSQFNFELPNELLAKEPVPNRDESKLMVLDRKKNKIHHKIFKDIINFFEPDDLFIFNNTKVFPARLYGYKEKTGAKIEVFLLRELKEEQLLWDVLVDPARKIRIGNKLFFGENESLVAEVIDNTTSRGRTLRFLFDGEYADFKKTLESLGETPLPKFMNRTPTANDDERYQTVYAKEEGAVAAPAAGMHFSKNLLKRFEIKGINIAEITLHVGLGNFRGVDVEDLSKHKMDSERMKITEETADLVNNTKKNGHKICAIGTTVMRAIESSVSTDRQLKPIEKWTNLFIFPPYDFQIPDAMVTNFHLPLSTPLMTVTAFAGFNFMLEAYETAIKKGYRFGAYGDAMLII